MSIPLLQKYPNHPERHPESHNPLTLLQPAHVSMHLSAHSSPKYPCWQANQQSKVCKYTISNATIYEQQNEEKKNIER